MLVIEIDRDRRELDVEFLHRLAVFVVVAALALDEHAETRLFLGAVIGGKLFAVAGCRHEIGNDIVGFQAQRDDVVGQIDLAVAHIVEQRPRTRGRTRQARRS